MIKVGSGAVWATARPQNKNKEVVRARRKLREQHFGRTRLFSIGDVDAPEVQVLSGNWSTESCTYDIGIK